MKKLILLLIFPSIYLLLSCGQDAQVQEAQTVFDEEKEKAAIMEVIEKETFCFYERDYDCWKKQWVQEDYAFQAWNYQNGSADAAFGFDAIDQQAKHYIDTPPEGQAQNAHPTVKRTDMRVKFYNDNLAYLLWTQYNSDRKNEFYTPSYEVRLMEKQDGAWKIVNVSAFWNNGGKMAVDSLDL